MARKQSHCAKIQLRPPRRRERRDTRPQEIVAAAFEEFAANGYAGTRLEDVASRARVSKGLPYLYFKTKEAAVQGGGEERHHLAFRRDPRARWRRPSFRSRPSSRGRSCPSSRSWSARARAFIARLLIAEGHKHPELTKFYYDQVVSRGIDTLYPPDRSRHRARRVQADAVARLSAAADRADAHRDHLAPAVRAPPSPRYRHAAQDQYRPPHRRHQGAWPQTARRCGRERDDEASCRSPPRRSRGGRCRDRAVHSSGQ